MLNPAGYFAQENHNDFSTIFFPFFRLDIILHNWFWLWTLRRLSRISLTELYMVPKLQKGHKKWLLSHSKFSTGNCWGTSSALVNVIVSSRELVLPGALQKAYGRLWLPFLGTSLLKKKLHKITAVFYPSVFSVLLVVHTEGVLLNWSTAIENSWADQLFLEDNSAPEADDSHPQTYTVLEKAQRRRRFISAKILVALCSRYKCAH